MEPPPEAAAAPPSTANDNPNKTRDQTIGLLLAMSSTIFIGSSFIIKKQGLRKAGAAGSRAGAGGFGYLRQPLWWIGMFAMIFGEAANFAAYAFAPAILVTPLGALSIIVSAVMAHFILGEKLNVFGVVGCLLCMNGSLTVVLHAPHEKPVESVVQIWAMALKPGFATYALLAILTCAFLIWYVGPRWGNTNILVYLLICSLAGSLSVMSVKALGVALKLTAQGDSQFRYPQTYISALVLIVMVVTQIQYLNRSLDMFNTAIVSPIYYVMFTSFTIIASVIMFQEFGDSWLQVTTAVTGFVTIVGAVFLLHSTRDMDVSWSDISKLTSSDRDGGERGSGGGGVGGGPALKDRKAYMEEMMPLPASADDAECTLTNSSSADKDKGLHHGSGRKAVASIRLGMQSHSRGSSMA